MHAIHVNGMRGVAKDIDLMAACIQQDEIQEVSKFYDRNEHICDWYYQCYAPIRPSNNTEKAAKTDSIAQWLGLQNTTGPIIMAKNGPDDAKWRKDMYVDIEVVARTIWWHYASGNDRKQVCGERELARFIQNL